jgi:protein-L-isoaspartate(D-aspartate) O-methyltransferase
MVEHDLRRRGIHDGAVLAAMGRVPRHRFVPPAVLHEAYADYPLSIGEGQTISQPYIVALMTEALALEPGVTVLELGTGSGYQAAILAECGARVWTIDRSPRLLERASDRLRVLGYTDVRTIAADGTVGLPDESPFDRILATGSLPSLPEDLLRQLSDGGIFVGPIGSLHAQELVRIVYHPGRTAREDLAPCRFVPLIGANGWDERVARRGFNPTP